MKEVIAITKALSDENRVRILMHLCKCNKDLCLCQLTALLDLSPSTVSKHIAVLLNAGLVTRRKDGRWHYYSLPKKSKAPKEVSAIKWLKKSLESEESIKKDVSDLKAVLKKGNLESCRHYRK